jgi:hypothetical protein
MILCEDWRLEPGNVCRATVVGLLSNIRSIDEPAYPLLYRELCVFLALTDGYGEGKGKIVCRFEETGQRIFESDPGRIVFGRDRLEVGIVSFRIRDCRFPRMGVYSVEFWYNNELLQACSLRLN